MAVADLGEVPGGVGGWGGLILDQTKAQRAEKHLFGDPAPHLRVWMTGAPLSEGLDPPLYGALQLNKCLSQAA